MIYIIDDSSVMNDDWVTRVDRKSKYIIIYTSSEPQRISKADLGTFMAKGIKIKFIRCNSIENIYMEIGFQVGQAFASGHEITLVSDSMEYDGDIQKWIEQGVSVVRESSRVDIEKLDDEQMYMPYADALIPFDDAPVRDDPPNIPELEPIDDTPVNVVYSKKGGTAGKKKRKLKITRRQ